MKIRIVFFLFLLVCTIVNSQTIEGLSAFNGEYFLMEPERSVQPGKQTTSVKKLEIAKHNQTILLGTSECEKCTPSVFTYQAAESKLLNKSVFFNNMGLYIIAVDSESFVYVIPSKKIGAGVWDAVRFSNYYSKDKTKVTAMNKDKLAIIIKELSKTVQQ